MGEVRATSDFEQGRVKTFRLGRCRLKAGVELTRVSNSRSGGRLLLFFPLFFRFLSRLKGTAV